jgi:putative ABC transport system permease protein
VTSLRPLLTLAWRESRFARRRLLLFLSSISLGVAALVATQSFAANLAASVREESRALLGADLSLAANRPMRPAVRSMLDSLRRQGRPVARQMTFASVALLERTGGTRLSQVRAIEPGFPFYGEILTEPANVWGGLQTGRDAVVDRALLTSLGASVGDSISLGETRFRVIGVIRRIPGEVGIASIFAPRLFIGYSRAAETRLVRFGSRVEHEAFVRMPTLQSADDWAKAHRALLRTERVRARTAQEQQRSLDRALGRLGRFLGMVGTFALLLGGIGVASAMGAYMAQKRETVATLRCLGATAGQVIVLYLGQALVMGLVGAGLGAGLGLGVQWVLPRLLADLLPVQVRTAPDLAAVATGIGIGVWTAAAFALLPLMATRRVSPLEALRRRVEAVRTRRDPWMALAWLILLLSAVGLVVLQVGDLARGLGFAAGVGVALVGLWLAALLAIRLVRGARTVRFAYPLRQGLANLYRPGNQTRVVVLALGFGVFLLSTLYQSQHNLLAPLRRETAVRGNLAFFDVQGEQEAGLRALLAAESTEVVQRAPIVPMRIHAINGVPVERLMPPPGDSTERPPPAEGERRPEAWALRREYRSTFRDTLVSSEELASGRMWAVGEGGGALPEVSLDQGILSDLGVALGDSITWDVQGRRIRTRVTSTREIDWQRLEPNFFAVFPERVLRRAPQTWVVLARADDPARRARAQAAVVRRYSNVAVMDLTEVQAAVDAVLDRVAAVIRFLAGFSVATGFIVLLGAVLTSRLQRIRESVLLRTLGATRRQVMLILLSEYAALGLLASVVGVGLAVGASWALARWTFEVPFSVAGMPLLVIAALVTLLAMAVGLWASREVFRHTPLEALREE